MNNMPNFIIVGAAKSGTTFLYHYLKSNPDIFLPDFKEPHYFASNHSFNFDTITKIDDYRELFKNQNAVAIGEASTAYLYYSDVPERIYSEIPNCKIIAVLRDPKERALSMWGHQVREGLEKRSFATAINDELSGKRATVKNTEFGFNYCKQGLISDNIKKYQFFFGKENVFIADYKMLREDPALLVSNICEFLEVKSHQIDTKPLIANTSGKSKSKLPQSFINTKHSIINAAAWPLKWLLPQNQRHQLWSHIRNYNILNGKKHTVDAATKFKLDKYFAIELRKLSKLMKPQ